MYIADTGLNRDDFTRYTATQGANARNTKCFDSFGNCPKLAKGCCFTRSVSNGRLMNEACCASCEYLNDSDPKCSDESANCFDKFSNCNKLAAMEYQCQRKEVATGCCKSCRATEESGHDRADGK